MEENGQKSVVNHFEAGSNCQVFNGNITGCTFAMPGSTVTQMPALQQEAESSGHMPSDEELARAIETCQEYFWGNSAYAVVFCIWRDDLKMRLTQTDFERKVEELPYKKVRDYQCPAGTIANAFCHNQIYNERVDDWDGFNPLPRIIKLRNRLRNALKL